MPSFLADLWRRLPVDYLVGAVIGLVAFVLSPTTSSFRTVNGEVAGCS